MGAVVEMFRDAAAPRGRDRFSCPVLVWELLWEIGQAFGWQPRGTTYIPGPDSKIEAPARRNYQPGAALDRKRVEDEDATAWARALEAAKQSPHLAAMLEARSAALALGGKTSCQLAPGQIEEFIEFAYGGAFAFAICDDASSNKEA